MFLFVAPEYPFKSREKITAHTLTVKDDAKKESAHPEKNYHREEEPHDRRIHAAEGGEEDGGCKRLYKIGNEGVACGRTHRPAGILTVEKLPERHIPDVTDDTKLVVYNIAYDQYKKASEEYERKL